MVEVVDKIDVCCAIDLVIGDNCSLAKARERFLDSRCGVVCCCSRHPSLMCIVCCCRRSPPAVVLMSKKLVSLKDKRNEK